MTGTVIHSSYVRGSLVGKGTQFPVDESVSGCAGSVSLGTSRVGGEWSGGDHAVQFWVGNDPHADRGTN
jgi:hypothetical protein